MDIWYMLLGWILLVSLCQGQTLDEPLKRETSTDCRNSTLPGICSKGAIIAVGSVQYGTKLAETCGLSNTSAGCCDYDPEDCLIDYTGTIQQYVCSGRDVCGGGTVAKGVSSSCGDLYPIQNHYLTMEYYCIPVSRVFSFCGASQATETDSTIYIQNSDYHAAIRSSETNCACSVETTSCSSDITTLAVHFQLADGSGTCTGNQKFHLDDGKGNIATYTCDNNTLYSISTLLTVDSSYLKITLDNAGGVNDGYLWLGIKTTEATAPLTITCPAVEQSVCKDCPVLTAPTDGSISTTAVSPGTMVTVSCNSDYTLSGSANLECQTNGTWDGPIGMCNKNCPVLTSPIDGSISTTAVIPGTFVTVTCDSGFLLSGDPVLECQTDGSWNSSVGTCEKVCQSLTAPSHGSLSTVDPATVGVTANVSCSVGYTLFGDALLTCQADGNWNGAFGTCIKDCPVLTVPDNGVISSTTTIFGSIVTVSCDSGYSIFGNGVIECQTGGVWNASAGTCGKGLGDSCTSHGECTLVTGATCKCVDGFTQTNQLCILTGNGESHNNGDSDIKIGLVIGVAIGAVVLILCLALVIYCVHRNRYRECLNRVHKRPGSSPKVVPETENDTLQNGEVVTETQEHSKMNENWFGDNNGIGQSIPPMQNTLKMTEKDQNMVESMGIETIYLRQNGMFRQPDLLHFDLSNIQYPQRIYPAQMYWENTDSSLI